MYFHAATQRCPEIDQHTPDYQHQAELAALTSPQVRAAVRESATRPTRSSQRKRVEAKRRKGSRKRDRRSLDDG